MSKNETAEAILIVIKRIAKWIFYALLAVLSAVLLFIAYDQIKQYLENRPKVIYGIKNINLGDKFSDFMFKHPGFVLSKEPPKRKENEIYYENLKDSLSVTFKDNLIIDVTYICKDNYEYTNVNGIACDGIGDSIFEKYGKDVRVQCLKDKSDKDFASYRVYDVVKYGIRHHVFSNQVKAFHIISPDNLKDYTGLNWVPCE